MRDPDGVVADREPRRRRGQRDVLLDASRSGSDSRQRPVLDNGDPDRAGARGDRAGPKADRNGVDDAVALGIDHGDRVRRDRDRRRLVAEDHGRDRCAGEHQGDGGCHDEAAGPSRAARRRVAGSFDRRQRRLDDAVVRLALCEGLVLPQDRRLEVAQLLVRLKPELVGEPPAKRLVGGEGVRLPPRAVEGKHEERVHSLLVRVRRGERLDLSDDGRMPAELELAFDPLELRAQAELFQLGEREPCGPVDDHVCERSPTPQRERVPP